MKVKVNQHEPIVNYASNCLPGGGTRGMLGHGKGYGVLTSGSWVGGVERVAGCPVSPFGAPECFNVASEDFSELELLYSDPWHGAVVDDLCACSPDLSTSTQTMTSPAASVQVCAEDAPLR